MMSSQEPVEFIRRYSNSGSGCEDGPDFIGCVDRRQTHIHEVCNFYEDNATREVHPTAQVDVGSGFIIYFSTDYLTPSWRRVPMSGRNSINGSVK